jgi:hypothetical protein
MNLQGRDLKLDLTDSDVQLLHIELAQIGLTVGVAQGAVKQQLSAP